jgi:uncharacterized protein (TIGR02145 family)
MKSIYTVLKIAFAVLLTFNLTLSNVSGQNDTMYVMKNGVIINKQSIKTSDVDSIIFYNPATTPSTSVTDVDGNVYQTVIIGTQTWMVEDLKTTKYNNSTTIPKVTNNTEWSELTTPGYRWYDNDSTTYAQTYGALYNWYVVETGELCPTGWHVPTDAEWTTLTDFLGGENVAGGKLKESGTAQWNSPNTDATNETGFTALPGGMLNTAGTFSNTGNIGGWWSATESGASGAWLRLMKNDASNVTRGGNNKKVGISVRCMKD